MKACSALRADAAKTDGHSDGMLFMRKTHYGGLMAGNEYLLDIDYACPQCGGGDVIEPPLDEQRKFGLPIAGDYELAHLHHLDWRCAACGKVAVGICFVRTVEARRTLGEQKSHEMRLEYLTERRKELDDRRKQLDEEEARHSFFVADAQSFPGQRFANNLTVSAEAARQRLLTRDKE